jgi:hypothetical protein
LVGWFKAGCELLRRSLRLRERHGNALWRVEVIDGNDGDKLPVPAILFI